MRTAGHEEERTGMRRGPLWSGAVRFGEGCKIQKEGAWVEAEGKEVGDLFGRMLSPPCVQAEFSFDHVRSPTYGWRI
jgi:hypothetical protein